MIISRRLKNHFETCEDFQWDIQNGTRTGIPPIFRTIFFFFFLLKEVRYYVGYLVSLFSSRYNLFALMTIRRRRDSKVNRPAREISAPEADYFFFPFTDFPSRHLRHEIVSDICCCSFSRLISTSIVLTTRERERKPDVKKCSRKKSPAHFERVRANMNNNNANQRSQSLYRTSSRHTPQCRRLEIIIITRKKGPIKLGPL